MPRKKIQPEDRQRSTIACTPCKKAKIRCNASSPCATCVKRGLESSCIYPEPAIRNHRRRRSQLGSSADGAPRHKPLATFLDTDLDPINDSTADHVSILDGSKVTEPESRILFTSKFQKGESPARGLFSIRTDADSVIVYIGETASLSYLQFLRRIVEHRMGASTPFSQGEFNNFMLENDVVGDGHDVLIDLDPENKTELAQCYLDAVCFACDAPEHSTRNLTVMMIDKRNTRSSREGRYTSVSGRRALSNWRSDRVLSFSNWCTVPRISSIRHVPRCSVLFTGSTAFFPRNAVRS